MGVMLRKRGKSLPDMGFAGSSGTSRNPLAFIAKRDDLAFKRSSHQVENILSNLYLATPLPEQMTVKAKRHMEQTELLISPMVLMELQYLFEIGRLTVSARDIQRKIEHELGVRVCNHPFERIVNASLDENWTRDAFDRIIVSHAKASGLAPLISSDRKMKAHYPRTIL